MEMKNKGVPNNFSDIPVRKIPSTVDIENSNVRADPPDRRTL